VHSRGLRGKGLGMGVRRCCTELRYDHSVHRVHSLQMSRTRILTLAALTLLIGLSFVAAGFRHQTGQIDRPQLKSILEQLGYEVKDLDTTAGKEKYSITAAQGGLNIPIAFEISANDTYIWLTVFLTADAPDGTMATNLLKKNADIQPSQFYITASGKLMMGVPIENHEVTNAVIRQKTTDILDHVVNTKDIWQKSP